MEHEPDRSLELDVMALASRARRDRGFADELYCALCNTDWVQTAAPNGIDRGGMPPGSSRMCARRACARSGRGLPRLYCSPTGAQGTISDRVREEMAALGWQGTGHGAPLRLVNFATGERKVLIDGDWLDE